MASRRVAGRRSIPEPGGQELLATKLMPSFIAGELLRRGRLFDKLDGNPGAKLVLVHASAGTGKSSLLYDFIRSQDTPVSWYSIQESDRDVKVFLSYLLAAIGLRHPAVTAEVTPRLVSMANPDQEWKPLLTKLINAMQGFGEEILLVLDDYHLLADRPPIPEMMSFLLLNSPSNFRCFVASRTAPDLPIAFLKSKNALTTLTPGDLLLKPEELFDLFHHLWNHPLSESALKLIQAKTEGWFAATRLIAQVIEGKSEKEAERYLQRLDSEEHLIYDYLAHEIYLRQEPEARTFLRGTSILTSFNADLAEWVTGLPHAAGILKRLEDLNLFVLHLDTREEWFRYHHLFSECLGSILRKEEGKERIEELHRRAAAWHEEHGNIPEAVEHFIRGGDFDETVRLLEEHGQDLFQQGLVSQILQWLSSIPRRLRASSPNLLLVEGEAHDISGAWERAVTCYEESLKLLNVSQNNPRVPAVLEKLILCLIKYGEYSKIFNYCHQALEVCPPEDKAVKARLLNWLGMAHVVHGENQWADKYKLLQEGYSLAHESGNPEAIASACISYGFMYHFPQGNFQEAERVFNEGAALLKRMGLPFPACHLIMNKAVVQVFAGNLHDAEQTIDEVTRIADEYGIHFVKQALLSTQAVLDLELRNMKGAKQWLQMVAGHEIPLQLRPWYYRSLVLLYLLEGNLEQATVAGQEMLTQLKLVGKGMYAPECYLVVGFLCWKRHLHHKARRWFEEALATAERGKMKFWVMKAHYALAALFGELGGASLEFKNHFHLAVRISRENNYWHFWRIDLFDKTIPLIIEAYTAKLEPEETRLLMEMIQPKLIEHLSSRLEQGAKAERMFACQLLGEIQGHDAVLLLKKARKDSVKTVRATAERALAAPKAPPPPLTISTFGRFSVSRGKGELSVKDWGRAKARQLFKYLLAAYPKEVVVDQLIETFWPNLPLKKARHNLSVYLNYVRKALNPTGKWRDGTFVEGTADIFRLNVRKEDQYDVLAFQSLFEAAETKRQNKEIESAILLYKEAIPLYKGEFLEEDPYEDWAVSRRGEFRREYLTMLEQVAAHHKKREEHQEALKYYQLYLQTDPLQEPVVHAMLRCLAALGDRASIRREYERFKKELKRQLALSPSLHMQAYLGAILADLSPR